MNKTAATGGFPSATRVGTQCLVNNLISGCAVVVRHSVSVDPGSLTGTNGTSVFSLLMVRGGGVERQVGGGESGNAGRRLLRDVRAAIANQHSMRSAALQSCRSQHSANALQATHRRLASLSSSSRPPLRIGRMKLLAHSSSWPAIIRTSR